MSAQFSLSDLIPEPLTFKDDAFNGEGVVFDVLTSKLLSSQDIAFIQRIRKRISDLLREKVENEDEDEDEEEKTKVVNTLTRDMNLLMKTLIPKMPFERICDLPLGAKEKFFVWWFAQSAETPNKKKVIQ